MLTIKLEKDEVTTLLHQAKSQQKESAGQTNLPGGLSWSEDRCLPPQRKEVDTRATCTSNLADNLPRPAPMSISALLLRLAS